MFCHWNLILLRGFAKLNKFQKNLDRAHPNHRCESQPPTHIQTFFFGNPSLPWTLDRTLKSNNQQLLAMYVQTCMVYYSKICSTCLGLFWDDFPTKKIRVRPGRTHPPTSLVISDFLNFFCKDPSLSVGVSKLQVTILAWSYREMSQTVRIDWHSFLSQVRISVWPSKFCIGEKHPKTESLHECSIERTSGGNSGHGWSPVTHRNGHNLNGDNCCHSGDRLRLIFDPGW